MIKYLEEHWTEVEIEKFVTATDKVIDYISVYPRMFRATNKKNIHEALITPHNLLIYKIYSSHIDLLTFWGYTAKSCEKEKTF